MVVVTDLKSQDSSSLSLSKFLREDLRMVELIALLPTCYCSCIFYLKNHYIL